MTIYFPREEDAVIRTIFIFSFFPSPPHFPTSYSGHRTRAATVAVGSIDDS